MLSWWSGHSGEDATNREDDVEPPETPAPVFAARAIKSAFFGTPLPQDEYEQSARPKSADMPRQESQPDTKAGELSPTKPQGILMTPGTAAARRKTVSFGSCVVDNEGKGALSKSGLPNDFPGKFPSPWTPRVVPPSQPIRQTNLTKAFENAREGKSKSTPKAAGLSTVAQKTSENHKVDQTLPSGSATTAKPDKRSQRSRTRVGATSDINADVTLDLNNPHSQSGKYWKTEYERYHEEAKAEMKKLIKYKQLAKSYAKKKDGEALDLVEKLHEEQQKVVTMEEKLTELAAQIARQRLNGADKNTPDLMRDLAHRTAFALRYKDEVDQFQAALYNSEHHDDNHKAQNYTSQTATQTIAEVSQELRKAREQLAEMNSLRSENHGLRMGISAAEKKGSKLKEENMKLSKDFSKTQEELARSERQRQTTEERSRKQEEMIKHLQTNYEELKEMAKTQRRDAEVLLKKRHDQVVSLKDEIRSLKNKAEVRHDFIRQDTHENFKHDIQSDVAVQKAKTKTRSSDLQSRSQNNDHGFAGGNARETRMPNEQRYQQHGRETDHKDWGIEDHIDKSELLVNGEIKGEDGAQNYNVSPHPDNGPQHMNRQAKSSQHALTEIVNNGQSPDSDIPLLESLRATSSGRGIRSKRYTGSPGPSMFHIASTIPQDQFTRPLSAGRDGSRLRDHSIFSSRLGSITSARSRTTLPPERAAAAKARLEQRHAEKRRKDKAADQKENIK